jgi:uncharacterized protein with NRDE domain
MCLIALASNVHPQFRLIVAANRDEYLDRPTAPLSWWNREILGGRDLKAGGGWMATHRDGSFAALTNVRSGIPSGLSTTASDLELQSRGQIINEVLNAKPDRHEQTLAKIALNHHRWAGFNLLHLSGSERAPKLHWIHGGAEAKRAQVSVLNAGIYGLSNATLDAPWPKSTDLVGVLTKVCKGAESKLAMNQVLFKTLADSSEYPDAELPDTQIGIDRERRLSAKFIRAKSGSLYGTRTSSILTIDLNGQLSFTERTWRHSTDFSTDLSPQLLADSEKFFSERQTCFNVQTSA